MSGFCLGQKPGRPLSPPLGLLGEPADEGIFLSDKFREREFHMGGNSLYLGEPFCPPLCQ